MERYTRKNQKCRGDNTDRHTRHSRREFLSTAALAGIGAVGMSAFLQSCAEKKVAPSTELARAYLNRLTEILGEVRERELDAIQKGAGLAVQAKLQGQQLYALMTGGMLTGEMDEARPGAPQIFITRNLLRAVRNDVVVTNDPYVVRDFNERLVQVIGFTRPSLANDETPPNALENMGTARIEDVADVIIRSHVPCTDGILEVNGVEFPIGPASGILHTVLFNALAVEVAEGLIKNGIYPRIG